LRRNHPRFQGENFKRNLDLVAVSNKSPRKKGCKASQLALAWVLAQGEDVVPIPGTTRRAHLEGKRAALELTSHPETLRASYEVAPKGASAGERYAEPGMKVVNL